MTKQELIKMTGSEEQAAYAMEILLKNCKKAFVEMAIRAELNEIEKEVKAFEEEGILSRYNGTSSLKWLTWKGISGLGPTRLISPTSTLKNCGNSSRLNLRMKLPKRVFRGSLFVLHPVFSVPVMRMLRNLYILKGFLFLPMRS